MRLRQSNMLKSTRATCKACGYNLTGLALGSHCPECGLPIRRSHQQRQTLPTSAMAVTALILGSLGLVFLFLPLCGLLFPLVTLIAGASAISEYRSGRANGASFGIAIAGMCLALLGIAVQALILISMTQ